MVSQPYEQTLMQFVRGFLINASSPHVSTMQQYFPIGGGLTRRPYGNQRRLDNFTESGLRFQRLPLPARINIFQSAEAELSDFALVEERKKLSSVATVNLYSRSSRGGIERTKITIKSPQRVCGACKLHQHAYTISNSLQIHQFQNAVSPSAMRLSQGVDNIFMYFK